MILLFQTLCFKLQWRLYPWPRPAPELLHGAPEATWGETSHPGQQPDTQIHEKWQEKTNMLPQQSAEPGTFIPTNFLQIGSPSLAGWEHRVSAMLSVGLGVNASNRIFILPGWGQSCGEPHKKRWGGLHCVTTIWPYSTSLMIRH